MDDLDLSEFSGRVRLFPLPGVVMFPHSVAPLHIFEPRYRRMTEDALAGDRLIAMVRLLGSGGTRPPIEAVGCLGRIIHHERLADGRFNILLLGRRRVRLLREVDEHLPYRTAEVELIDDLPPAGPSSTDWRQFLMDRLRRALGDVSELDPEFFKLLESAESLGALTDVMAHALPFSAERKQSLLGEPSVVIRSRDIGRWLADLASGSDENRPFPPPFSDN